MRCAFSRHGDFVSNTILSPMGDDSDVVFVSASTLAFHSRLQTRQPLPRIPFAPDRFFPASTGGPGGPLLSQHNHGREQCRQRQRLVAGRPL